jgi:hypothetical protein
MTVTQSTCYRCLRKFRHLASTLSNRPKLCGECRKNNQKKK